MIKSTAKKKEESIDLAWGRSRGDNSLDTFSVLKKLVLTVTSACSSKGTVEALCTANT